MDGLRLLLRLSLALWLSALPRIASAHGEELKVGGAAAAGPITLSAAQSEALGVKTAAAEFRPVAELLRLNATVAPLPDAEAEVTLRISGRVEAVLVNVGDTVRKGQLLAQVQSRAFGDPPVTVPVRAPLAGLIDLRRAVVGQSVEPDSVLFHVSERSRMRVVGRAYEEDLGKLREGQPAQIRLLAYPEAALAGTVTLIGPSLDPDTRTVEVWVLVDNRAGLLKPNLFARAAVELGRREAALTVPNAAVVEAGGMSFVFVRDGDTFHRAVIATGARDEAYTEITDGLVPGDEVVIEGVRELYTVWLAGGQTGAED
ncbi:MAG: efflux RND transporter periplasmic adaptor subunit [Gammaproteobacteria bacterium]|nr:efflux RND transporter periplasmic adaptor subunit [Gammaproteobacteria bacterium]